jgi:hypothetical protein
MSDPRGKRVLFMSISAVPAHRDQCFEVCIHRLHPLSSLLGNQKLTNFFISFSILSISPLLPPLWHYAPFVRHRNYGSRITSRRTRPPADHQLRFPKNQLILPPGQVWNSHYCSSHTSTWRRRLGAEPRRNKTPLPLKSMAFHKARTRKWLDSRLSIRKSLSEGIHLRCVFVDCFHIVRPLLAVLGDNFLFPRLQPLGSGTDRPLHSGCRNYDVLPTRIT